MPTETIKCPACGEEVSQGVENCPSCGAPVGVLFDNDISGAPIDNSAAIDAMLRSASQFMEESEALGLDDMDIFDGDEEDEPKEEDETVFKKVTLRELPPELSEEQKDGIQSGGVINLSPSGEAKDGKAVQIPDRAPAQAAPKAVGTLPDDLPDFSSSAAPAADGFVDLTSHGAGGGQSVPTASAPAEAAETETEPAPEKAKKPKKEKNKAKKNDNNEPTLYEVDENGNPVKEKPKKEKRKREKKPKIEKVRSEKSKGSPLGGVIAAVVALAVGLCGGYFAKTFIFPELPVPECQEFAQMSVDSVVKSVPSDRQLYIAEAYVNEGVYSTQCIFRAFAESGEESVTSGWYRVKVNRDNENRVEVYFELNNDEYERLRDSDNTDDRAWAAILKSNQNELERCIKEAKSGEGWSSANISLLNNKLHPYTEPKETETETETESSGSAQEEQ